MKLFLFFFILSSFWSGCGGLDSTDSVGANSGHSTQPESVLFTATDITFSSSQLLRMDFDGDAAGSGSFSQPLLSGSGDMVLFRSQDRVFVFNRSAQDLNFRQISTKRDGDTFRWEIGRQFLTPVALAGDPHDVLVLDDELLMLANYVKGLLAIVNFKTGALKQVIRIPERFLGKRPFRPESLAKLSDTKVGVIHQGYDENYQLNESQAAFVVEKNQSGQWLVSGDAPMITLGVHVPQGLFQTNKGKFQTVGLCFAGVDNCQAGVEEIDFDGASSKIISKIKNSEMTYYGAPIALADNRLVMSAQHHTVDRVTNSLTVIGPQVEKIDRIYDFPNKATSGYWGYTASRSGQFLFFGDPAGGGKGEFSVYDFEKHAVIHTHKTPLIPYSMIALAPDKIID